MSKNEENLSNYIFETQSIFIAGNKISCNIMIAQSFHALRKKSGRRRKIIEIKTYMIKAYNKMEWDFIRAVIENWVSHPHGLSGSCNVSHLLNIRSS